MSSPPIAWSLTLTSDETYGLTASDGRGSFASIWIYPTRGRSLTGRQILVWGRGSAGLLHRCLALRSGENKRSTAGATVCWASLIEACESGRERQRGRRLDSTLEYRTSPTSVASILHSLASSLERLESA